MGPLLITAGRVYDGVAARALERAYVVMDGDAITAVGPQTELEGHGGRFERVIDLGAETTVLPGLINMHTHMSFSAGASIFDDHQRESYETKLIRAVENVQAALRTGVTTVRDCGTLNGIAFAVRAAVESGCCAVRASSPRARALPPLAGTCGFVALRPTVPQSYAVPCAPK
jgi:imidazolonepropionase-like amidohydrolase